MKLFISYRQEDTGGYATELFRRLQQAFGRDNVFFDVKSIALGEDWLEVVQEHIQDCNVLLLPIGPQWLTVTDKKGRTRLENPRDPLRVEIEAAMRAKLHIIPLLIGDTKMPDEDQLPGELRHLAKCIAQDLRHASFDRDVDYLITVLRGSPGSPDEEGASDAAASRQPPAPMYHQNIGQQAPQVPAGGFP